MVVDEPGEAQDMVVDEPEEAQDMVVDETEEAQDMVANLINLVNKVYMLSILKKI
jgi:hypothetical protein